MSTNKSSPIWLMKPIKALLLDITGVLYESGTNIAIDGSIDAIQKLRNAGVPFRLITNETQRTVAMLIQKLAGLGYDFIENEVITPAMICREFIRKNQLRPHFLIHPNLEPEFNEIIIRHNPNCVVIGDADDAFTYQAMNNCFKLLMSLKEQSTNENLDHLLIGLGRNKYYRENGQLKLDLGGYLAALEYSTDLRAKIIGKPSKDYFQNALDSFGGKFSKEDLVMIGDDITGDVKGAQDFGVRGVLVRTGKYTPSMEQHPSIKPDAIVDNLKEAIDLIVQKNP
ncbi:hypothetical protein NH340_JMT05737 [Sarcoptes scabiei]|nr:hypothetical protein NH340_JMT05737 [Sarcoptes scabiei]